MKMIQVRSPNTRKKEPLVTVIVPVYRVEQAIHECLNSILIQDYEELEIILVNDGSPDSCGAICDDYAGLDSRVSVIHQENRGLSAARNAGIAAMAGEFVTFVDGDDLLSPYFVSTTINAMRVNAFDIVSTASQRFAQEYHPPKAIAGVTKIARRNMLEMMFYQENTAFGVGAPARLYKSSLFESIRFPEGLYYEDLGTTYRLFLSSLRIGICESELYGYRINDQGIVRSSINEEKLKSRVVADWLVRDIGRQEPALMEAAISRKLSFLFFLFTKIPLDEERYRDDAVAIWIEIKQYRKQVLFNARVRRKTRAACLVSYLGPGILNGLFNLVRR